VRLQITAQVLQLIQRASSMWANVRDFGRDVMELAKLEAKLAIRSAVSIALLGVAVVLLLFTGWILLISGLVAWLAEIWLSLTGALLLVGLIIVAAAVPLILMIKRHAGNLDFKATRRQLGMVHDTTITQPPRPN
jgi:Putative Actinobacterial Holin-X, holin superfamily III